MYLRAKLGLFYINFKITLYIFSLTNSSIYLLTAPNRKVADTVLILVRLLVKVKLCMFYVQIFFKSTIVFYIHGYYLLFVNLLGSSVIYPCSRQHFYMDNIPILHLVAGDSKSHCLNLDRWNIHFY